MSYFQVLDCEKCGGLCETAQQKQCTVKDATTSELGGCEEGGDVFCNDAKERKHLCFHSFSQADVVAAVFTEHDVWQKL